MVPCLQYCDVYLHDVSIDCVDREGLYIDIMAVRKIYLALKLNLKK